MRHMTNAILLALTLVLVFWLVWGFWPLGMGSRLFLSAVISLVAGVMGWRIWQKMQTSADLIDDVVLPPEDFAGALVLVCGDSNIHFSSGQAFRETRQGWYLPVSHPEQLAQIAESVAASRPALVTQTSVLLVVAPERWQKEDDFSSQLHQWQRAIAQSRRFFAGAPPVQVCLWLNGPAENHEGKYSWYFLTDNREGIQVQGNNAVAMPYLSWCAQAAVGLHTQYLDNALWLTSLFIWLKPRVMEPLRSRHHDIPALPACAFAVCCGPLTALPDNLWQQHIAALTTLTPRAQASVETPPLPDMLLSALSRRHGISRGMLSWRLTGGIIGLFLLLAMLASWLNNQRLIQNISDHLAVYQHLSGTPPAPKAQAQEQLRRDHGLLDTWQHQGAPVRYSLGLYQGLRLLAPLRAAINSWAPPVQPPAVVRDIIEAPQTIRLDNMSLFDSGKYALKPGSTKLLINSLIDIKARPGWLIVVAGHTDNSGNSSLNQTLSQKRAEAVRDWMRDTGDVPESCFAVQGYGESRPIATNDTPEGRALNRRVDISLVPQADACRIPGETRASSQDDDVVQN